MPAYEPLAYKRIQRMFRALQDVRQIPANLRFLSRTPIQPATDGEIMARLTERSIIADIVADDQAALVRNDHSITLEATKIPNVKRGTSVTQEMLNLIDRIRQGQTIGGDDNIFENYLQGRLERLLVGVRMQMNLMCAGMWLDAYSWSGGGVTTGTVTFGTPSDMKVDVDTSWATAASATPIADIQETQTTAREKYGKEFNRITMSSADFRDMIRTDEFRNLAAVYSQIALTSGNFPVSDTGLMQTIAGRILNMTIELEDSQYGREANDGEHSYTRYLPTGKVVLSNSGDDNDPMVTDFANGIVTETVAGSMSIQGAPRMFNGPEYGPLAFATLPNVDLNPPNVNLWGVARGFPRKHNQVAHAVLTVD